LPGASDSPIFRFRQFPPGVTDAKEGSGPVSGLRERSDMFELQLCYQPLFVRGNSHIK
jgi:hypothetical protein